MSSFEQAVETVFANEGGLSDHPADPGVEAFERGVAAGMKGVVR